MTEEKEEDIPPHGLSKRLFSLYNKAKESGVTERALDRFFVPFGPYADVVQAQRRQKGTEGTKEKDKVTAKIKPVQEVVKYDMHGGAILATYKDLYTAAEAERILRNVRHSYAQDKIRFACRNLGTYCGFGWRHVVDWEEIGWWNGEWSICKDNNQMAVEIFEGDVCDYDDA